MDSRITDNEMLDFGSVVPSFDGEKLDFDVFHESEPVFEDDLEMLFDVEVNQDDNKSLPDLGADGDLPTMVQNDIRNMKNPERFVEIHMRVENVKILSC
jgi:hypothetical protein